MIKPKFSRIPPKRILLNKFIVFPRFVVIDENGKNLGVMECEEALKLAESKDLDLFCVNSNPDNPLCKILNYGKFQYEKQKQIRKTKKNQTSNELKEIRFSPTIGDEDLKVKLQNAQKFLKDNRKVKISMRLRGRERYIKGYGIDKLNSVVDKLKNVGEILQPAKLINRIYNVILAPINKVKKNDKNKNENQEVSGEENQGNRNE